MDETMYSRNDWSSDFNEVPLLKPQSQVIQPVNQNQSSFLGSMFNNAGNAISSGFSSAGSGFQNMFKLDPYSNLSVPQLMAVQKAGLDRDKFNALDDMKRSAFFKENPNWIVPHQIYRTELSTKQNEATNKLWNHDYYQMCVIISEIMYW